jgi:selenide, water dikinase
MAMKSAVPVLKDIVLIGAGHAHVSALRMFGMNPVPGVRLTLITRQVHTPYSGMLPGLIAGHYSFDDVHIDTGPLTVFAGARLYQSEVVGFDLADRKILCNNRPPVPYDILSIDIGSTPSALNLPGVAEHAIPVKPIDRFNEKFEAARQRILASNGRARVVTVGGGAAGVELTLALHQRLRRDVSAAGFDPNGLSFEIVTAANSIVPVLPNRARSQLEKIARERGIRVRTNARVSAVETDHLRLNQGEPIAFDALFWTTEAVAAPWLTSTGLALDGKGFIAVDDSLRSTSHPDVFAAGDVASMANFSLPKSGVYAVRQGKYLAENLRRAIAGTPLQQYRPQRTALYLISTGGRHAVGARSGISFSGAWAWRWKDRIDRKFMAKFNALPAMAEADAIAISGVADKAAIKEISAIAMRCGGCGAKIGATVLSRALNEIKPAQRDDIIIGLNAPDDAAVVDTGGERLSVQTVDYFRAIIDDPYLFGKIAANHALGDVYAMGGEPQSALAIATIPYGPEAKVEADLSALMFGANEILRDANCSLVGGHTSEGAELALGFAVNGLVQRQAILRKGGLVPGDALVLTKPIGTGTLLAAHMRGKAKARWIMAALDHMIASNRLAAEILRQCGAHGSTDVTGFGLLGHLLEMVRASDVDAILNLSDIPLLDGARETVASGIFSSLQPQNVRLRRGVRNLEEASANAIFPLLFDPQTAGGLLASVAASQVAVCVAELRAAGYVHAAIIGSVSARSAATEPVVISFDVLRQANGNE